MGSAWNAFEAIVRQAGNLSHGRREAPTRHHPFDERNIHPSMPTRVRKLFDDGHCSQASFEAFKYLDQQVQAHSGSGEFGFKLMMAVFGGNSPAVPLNPMKTASENDEQKGFQFLFAGSVLAIRNPRGHQVDVTDHPDTCLDHLSLASMLLRRLSAAGFPPTT
jgi:uncharacterized protein (TIGR02391 family)